MSEQKLQAMTRAVAKAKARLASAQGDRDAAVRDALADGVPIARIAEIAGVTRMRVYQIRDRTR